MIEDFENNPDDCQLTSKRTEDATGKKYKGGKVDEELFTHKETGRVIERQTIYGKSGNIKHKHHRVK